MPVRFDPEKKELVVGVGDLVAAIVDMEGSTSESLGSWRGYVPGRGRLGGDIHRSTQREAGAADPDYLREVFLRGLFKISGYEIVLQGRLDALFRRNGEWVAQEIKTVAMPSQAFQRLSGDDLKGFEYQLLTYLYLMDQSGDDITVRKGKSTVTGLDGQVQRGELLLVNLYDQGRREFPVSFGEAETAEFVQAGLECILRNVLEEYERKQELKLLSKNIRFPHRKYRPFQKEMAGGVRKGLSGGRRILLTAPTGSGKTAAALTPTLRHVMKNGFRLFIVTSKTTQQWLMWTSLKVFRKQGVPFRGVLLRAKEKLCPEPVMICHESVCKYTRELPTGEAARDMFSRLWNHGMLDPDLISEMAMEYEVCPFELSLALAYQADVIVGDYNYVFDPSVMLQRFLPEDWANTVLMVDEIHNLYPRGREIYSPELPRHLIQRSRKELVGNRSQSGIPAALARNIGKWLGKLDKQFKDLAERGRLEYPDMAVHSVELDVEIWEKLLGDLESLVVRYLLEIRIRELFPQENPLVELYWSLSKFVSGFGLEEGTYQIVLEQSRPQRLKIHCLDPSGPIGYHLNRTKAMVGLSATLQPVEFFMTVLGLAEDDTDVLAFPSAFPPENRLVAVVGNVSTRYRYRSQFLKDIGDIISRIIDKKRGNYLVFFPSYGYLRAVESFVMSPGYFRVFQEPGLSEEQRIQMVDFLKGDRPVLMFAVQGGIFSEGMDYPGQSVIGGIVVGPGLPQVSYETELLREYYDRTRSQGFEFAYLYPGMSRVIQSAGRVIRSPKDRGIIVLVGERFTKPPYNEMFPEEWCYGDSGLEITDWEQAIEEFWSERGD